MSGIAKIEPGAVLTPTKQELVASWLPTQDWFVGDAENAQIVGAFRFVDPEGEVGIETQLVACDGITYHVPLTYRAAPLEGADGFLIGTMEHSTLGTRYTYDATGDPVYVSELIRIIEEGDNEAERSLGPKTATCQGSGVVPGSHLMGAVRITRAIGHDEHFTGAESRGQLTAFWKEGDADREALVACLR